VSEQTQAASASSVQTQWTTRPRRSQTLGHCQNVTCEFVRTTANGQFSLCHVFFTRDVFKDNMLEAKAKNRPFQGQGQEQTISRPRLRTDRFKAKVKNRPLQGQGKTRPLQGQGQEQTISRQFKAKARTDQLNMGCVCVKLINCRQVLY